MVCETYRRQLLLVSYRDDSKKVNLPFVVVELSFVNLFGVLENNSIFVMLLESRTSIGESK